jgi:Putative peptidoglycan binding domain
MNVPVLATRGIQRAAEVVELAASAGLDLACAVVMLEKESHGGRNVWGHDAVRTGGIYVKGDVVTESAYLAYKARRSELGAQGVGPCQLTWRGFQDMADARGGCWNWSANVAVGFETLAGLIRRYGEREGFRRYNGAGPAAERYADDAMARLAAWRSRLTSDAGPDSLPTLREGDEGPAVVALQKWLNDHDWTPDLPLLVVDGSYGPRTVAVVRAAQRQLGLVGTRGTPLGPRTRAAFWGAGFRG